MRRKFSFALASAVFLLLVLHTYSVQSEKAKDSKPETEQEGNKENSEEEDEEEDVDYDPLPEEENPGPFQLRRLNYVLVTDNSEPHYFEKVGARRLASIKAVRQAFRRKALDHRDGLMRLYNRTKIEPNVTNTTNITLAANESAAPGSENGTAAEGANATAQIPKQESKGSGKKEEQQKSKPQVPLKKGQTKRDPRPPPVEKIIAPNIVQPDLRDFLNMTEAYRVLTDPVKKQIYEVSGVAGLHGKGKPKFNDPLRDPYKLELAMSTGSFKIDFGFKEGQTKSTGNVHHNIKIPMIGFYTGFHMDVAIVRGELCPHCNGSGAATDATMLTCPDCKGVGKATTDSYWRSRKARQEQRRGGVETSVTVNCKKCEGAGRLASEPCPRCSGKKTLDGKVTVTVDIEPGMLEGHAFTFKEHAEQMPDTLSGDVILHIYSEEHEDFEREGNDLVTFMNITLMEALMGWQREIKHLDGRLIKVERTEVTKPGQNHEVPGMGMPIFQKPGEFGKLIIKLNIVFPERIAVDEERARELKKADERAKLRRLNRFSADDDEELEDDEEEEEEEDEEEDEAEDEAEEEAQARTQRTKRRAPTEGEEEEEEEEEDDDSGGRTGRTRGGAGGGSSDEQQAKPAAKKGVGMFVEPEYAEGHAEGGERVQLGLRVKKLLPGGPADHDGRIQVGDMLLEVGGVAVGGMKLRELAAHLVGAEGSLVDLTLLRGGTQRLKVQLPRGDVTPPKDEL